VQAAAPSARPEPTPARDAVPPEPAAEADRRPVSVLFADISGFTALSERADPEDIRAFQSDLLQEMTAVIKRFDGFIEKFVGDAIMSVFGAPVAHEDDPERALRAALTMHERMEGLNRRWASRFGRPLALHIGVDTGPVVAGTIGSTSGAAYAVTGDTVNTASRLQNAAQPGQTLVSVATYRLTQHAFAFEPGGDLALKGKAEPIPVYRVLGALAAPRPARGLEVHGLMAPLVGREDELAQMLAAFDRMVRGRAQVVSLIGEAGVGKSRLLSEFLAKLEANGQLERATVRRAACSSLGEQTYGVLATFFREAYGVAPHDALEVAQRKLVAGLEGLGADAAEAQYVALILGYVLGLESGELVRHIEPEQLKRHIFLAHRTLVERRLQQGPLVLVVEDLHWADVASIELLRFVVDRLADRQLMLLFTYRPMADAEALATSRVTHTAIRLAPLSIGESEALLGAFFGPSANRLPAHLRELIVGRAGGNPFYLEEVVRSLIAGGVLVRRDSVWTCTADVSTLDVPKTIQGLLLSRLDRLPPDARRLAQEAAVLGMTFELRLLRMICSDQDACNVALEQLLDAELLEEGPSTAGGASAGAADRGYRFSHALVQEVVYQNFLVRRRRELHGRAGHALETLVGDQPQRLEDLESLGHHFSLSADKAKGARYLMAAGDWARDVYANDDAVRHYERALKTLEECESCEGDRVAVRERVGDMSGRMGQRDTALEHYEAVRGAHEAAGDGPAQARVQRKIGRLYWEAGDRDRARDCCQAGLALLEGHAEDLELAHLYQEMGRMAFRSGDNHGAVEWAERALAQAQGVGAASAAPSAAEDRHNRKEAALATVHACNTLGVALARLERPEEAAGHIERSVAVAQEHDLLPAACRSYANLGVLYSTLNPGRAIETCLKGLEVAKKIGDLGFQSRLYTNLAVAYCALTNRCDEQGIGAAQTAINLDRGLGQRDHLAVPLIVLGQIYQCHGHPDLALTHYQEALSLAQQVGEPQLLFPCYDGLATLYLEMGDEARGEEYMLKAQQVCEAAGLDPDSLAVLPFLD
jgi:adenylate cyclase